MQKTVTLILGTAFSGSSLLNSLFDAQPKTRGLGEAVHLINSPSDAWCSHCKCGVEGCSLKHQVRPDRFYESVFAAYPDSDVIVNSSKHWGLCFRHMPIPPEEYRICLIILSKSLEEFAHSYSTHQSCGYEEAFDVWIKFYDNLFGKIDGVLNETPKTEIQRQLISRFAEPNIAYVNYRELTTQTDQTLSRLCNQLQLPLDANYREELWRGDTCVIGGNNAVFAQRAGNAAFFGPERNYLDGKYSGRQGFVFYDDAWMENVALRNAADQIRNTRNDEIEPLQQRLSLQDQRLQAQDSHSQQSQSQHSQSQTSGAIAR